MIKRLFLACLFLGLATHVFAEKQLVRVEAPTSDEKRALAGRGFDFWEFNTDHAIGMLSTSEARELRARDFEVEVIYETATDYLEAIRAPVSRQGSDAGAYTTYDELRSELSAIAAEHPDIVSLFNIGSTIEGRKLWMVKISDNVNVDENEPEIMVTGCHHAREWISIEVPLHTIRQLTSLYGEDPEVTNFVNSGEIFIIPMVNPDGHNYTVTTDRLWRKNRRNNGDGTFGVDLNRNYDYGFGGGGTDPFDPDSLIYPGPFAFSEPETQAIRDFVNERNLVAEMCFHSYSQLVLYPWGCEFDPSPDDNVFAPLAQEMSSVIQSTNGEFYDPIQASELYIACGTSIDWLYAEHGITAFTIELRPDSFSFGGFVLPESEIQPTVEENFEALRVFFGTFIPEAPDTPEAWVLY